MAIDALIPMIFPWQKNPQMQLPLQAEAEEALEREEEALLQWEGVVQKREWEGVVLKR